MLIHPKPNIHEPLPDGRTLPSVGRGKIYVVVSITSDDFQLVDENGEPIFVPQHRFEVIDESIPSDWVKLEDATSDWYRRGPPECSKPGFFERWHDGHSRERRIFAEVYERLWRQHESRLHGQEMVLSR